MNILIAYATNSSATEEVAHLVATQLRTARLKCDVRQVATVQPADVLACDGLMLGSCTWDGYTKEGHRLEGQVHEDMQHFFDRMQGVTLADKPAAVFALGDRRYTDFGEAAVYMEHALHEWHARQVGESLRIDGFFFHRQERTAEIIAWANHVAGLLVG